MSADLNGRTCAVLATDGVEQVEMTEPWSALEKAGASVHLVSTNRDVQGYNHLDAADSFQADRLVADADPADYDLLVLPGGVANPDALRQDDDAVRFARSFLDDGKVVAAICHAPWTLIEADAVRGRRMTSWPSLHTDLSNAGADWVDEAVVVDESASGTLITSRKPDDIPAFVDKTIEVLAAR